MASSTLVPMLRAPETWPSWAVGAAAIVVLAVLDLVGSVAAKEWSRGVGAPHLGVGVVALVTLGWIVVPTCCRRQRPGQRAATVVRRQSVRGVDSSEVTPDEASAGH